MLKAVAVIGLLSVAGCELGDVTPTAQPSLRVLDPSEQPLVSVTADGLFIDTNARVLEGLGIGDVIVSGGSDPFLRKVLTIGHAGGRIALATEPAALTDAILDGEMHSSGDVFSRPMESSGDKIVIPIDQLALDFNNTKLVDEAGVTVEIDRGTVRFRPSLDVDLQVAGGSLSHFHAFVTGQLSASMGLKVTASRSFDRSFSKTIWKSPAYRAVQFVGPVPVVEVVYVSLIATGNASANATGTVALGSVSANANLEAGASYDDGTWSAIADPGITLDARGPSAEVSASANAAVTLTMRVDVRLYDIAGPYLTVGAYARAAVSTVTGWTGRVGIEGAFGGDVSVFGTTLAGYNQELFDIGRGFSAP